MLAGLSASPLEGLSASAEAIEAPRDGMYAQLSLVSSRSAGFGIEVPAFTLKSLMSNLGHRHIDLLKMNIEGAEFDVLENMLDAGIMPRQLMVEFHHRFPGIGPGRTAGVIDRLRSQSYRIVAISDTGREVSFLHDG